MKSTLRRTSLKALALVAALGFGFAAPQAVAQSKTVIRISTPAVPDDWHAKMWTVFKDTLEKSAPGQFDVQIHLNATLFKQGTEPAAMARGNLEMSAISAQDISKIVPEFSIFTAGYIIRDPAHQQKVFDGPVGAEVFKPVVQKMEVTPLAYGEVYLALKTGTIDGQDNPLPSVRAAKFYEVSKTIVLTSHLVDAIFLSYSTKAFNALKPEQQQKVKLAAEAAARYNNANRIKDEAELVDFFKAQGLKVITPDVAAFRKTVQEKYLKSDMAKVWPKGLLERINAVQ